MTSPTTSPTSLAIARHLHSHLRSHLPRRWILGVALSMLSACAQLPEGAGGPGATGTPRAPGGASGLGIDISPGKSALGPKAPSTADTSRDLIPRIQRGFGMPELPSRLTASYEDRFTRNPAYLQRVLQRGAPYLHHIVEALEARGMPTELALLPIVESAFNPGATSHAKAAGLWQFIPSTGRNYDLSQNWWVDERRDVFASTEAALTYLQNIYQLQGNDWFLALASYNWGEGAVMRAVRKAKAAGKSGDYTSLKMPRETRNYVPQLIALRNIVRNPGAYGVSLPFIPDVPSLAVIDKEFSIDLDLVAELAEMDLDDFKKLNPHLHRPVLSVSSSNRIVLPIERLPTYEAALKEYQQQGLPLVSWAPMTLQKGDSIASIARRTEIDPSELARANGLASAQTVLLPGSTLLVPLLPEELEKFSHQRMQAGLASFAGARLLTADGSATRAGRLVHVVRKGETLSTIARRHRTSVAAIRRINPRLGNVIRVGQRIIVRQGGSLASN